jgi:hypothetical protein
VYDVLSIAWPSFTSESKSSTRSTCVDDVDEVARLGDAPKHFVDPEAESPLVEEELEERLTDVAVGAVAIVMIDPAEQDELEVHVAGHVHEEARLPGERAVEPVVVQNRQSRNRGCSRLRKEAALSVEVPEEVSASETVTKGFAVFPCFLLVLGKHAGSPEAKAGKHQPQRDPNRHAFSVAPNRAQRTCVRRVRVKSPSLRPVLNL